MACSQFAFLYLKLDFEKDTCYLFNIANRYVNTVMSLYSFKEYPISIPFVFKEWSNDISALSLRTIHKHNVKLADI